MDIWGNILKETTRVGYLRQAKKSQKAKDQEATLKRLVQKAKYTDFGAWHSFEKIQNAQDIATSFKQYVPITNYEQFHEQWLSKSLDGKRNVIWPGKINFYALSSGTTNSPSKRIPVTESMLRQFQKTTVKQVVGLHDLELPAAFFESNVLIIGGSTELVKTDHYHEGDLSGILAKNKSVLLSSFTKPKKKVARIRNWDKKMDEIVRKAEKWDIGIIAGVPSWVALLLERIVRHYNVESIHEIWPNFSVYSHGGIFLAPYKQRIERVLKKPICYQNTYLASEGYFAFQQDFHTPGMELLLSDGIYFEFVEQKYFDQLNEGRFENIPTLDIEEVRMNTPYAILISTCSGLWRYSIGDVIRFIDLDSKKIEIIGRVSFNLNLMGEHLSDGNIQAAIKYACKELRINVEEFCVHPTTEKGRHEWYIGLGNNNKKVISSQFADLIDNHLKDINDDYASVRKYTLNFPKVHAFPVERFYDFMALKGKVGGQNKFPRILKEEQVSQWRSFLEID